jgi:nitrite reductase/ring-hydroxylating ferredoxin subunit/hemoglobin-like flavoprotein
LLREALVVFSVATEPGFPIYCAAGGFKGMEIVSNQNMAGKQGAADSDRYFQYMAQFIDFSEADAETIRETRPIVEKHLPELVTQFYSHLLRHPPTRKFFIKKDGSIDQPYVELRMRHLTNFWLHAASGVYDNGFAGYVDYVGRAHTSYGADSHIYIAERYVIGQVGFMQHAISEVLSKELRHVDEAFEVRAIEAWDKLMMVILEMLSRAYGNEREAETFEPIQSIDQQMVERLALDAVELEEGTGPAVVYKDIVAARVDEIPDGERKILNINHLSIGLFHHKGNWYALRNLCLHRGGPVCTGKLEGDTLTCPWHGFQYNVTDGHLLVDDSAHLDSYHIQVRDGEIHLFVPDRAPLAELHKLHDNEFRVSEVAPEQIKLVRVDEENVAVFNVDGTFFATQEACTHQGGPLSEGTLDGKCITCPIHGSRFDLTTGAVIGGPATKPLKTYCVEIKDDVASVLKIA